MHLNQTISCIIILVTLTTCKATPASPHIHSHHHGEREEDGGYSPRDNTHYVNGEHHSEFDHEAILGSVKEAEEFDQLEPEEAKRRLRILLNKMDLNGDEAIDRNELHAWILRSFKMLSEEESQDRFEDADENEDGKVIWVEYIADSYGVQGEDTNGLPSPSNLEDEKLIKDDKLMFEAADKNKDGSLDKNEFLMFTHPEEHPEMLPLLLKQTLQEKDTDGDGFISFQEFIGDRGKHQDKEWLVVEKEKFDEEFDRDKDGKLNGPEILSWVVPSNEYGMIPRKRLSGAEYRKRAKNKAKQNVGAMKNWLQNTVDRHQPSSNIEFMDNSDTLEDSDEDLLETSIRSPFSRTVEEENVSCDFSHLPSKLTAVKIEEKEKS